ncbi:tyrosine-type recombinase/integrase [Pseudonocardia asaccharolytica]|uniref:Site-specific integrase n=1 Tax=Pseudonocardia asaccharolytica DSM 44247 = NBRC 16224 TaxID=1123024 RepID=A0A511D269_9PSEU|nr:site-specific integrase [Pseudonocardia asaccharolytica]GEL18623.1 site-specific integrase [Pseudonocardia asaccharolytica DSM 44247 = NBRC 16224]
MSRNANGEGSVWHRKDGRWCAAAYLPVVTGGRRRVVVYGKTRQEARAKLRELLDKAERQVPATPAGLSVGEYLAEWLTHIRQHVRPSTWAGYESNVRLHLVPRIGKRKLARLTVRDVRLMVDAMRADGMNPRSIQYAHATLRSALEHACREELVSRNVARLVRIQTPTPLKPREPLSAAEARKLLAATRGQPLDALWALLLMLGLRRSEACALRWDDIDFAARTLRIARSVQRVDGRLRELPTKTRRSNRTVHLPPRCLYALAEHHRRLQELHGSGPGRPWPPTGYVFGTRWGTPLEPRNLTRMFGRLCDEHGIRRVPLHGLRHTCVSLLLALGIHPRVVMEIVGHSAIEMTMNVYGHVNLETQRAALDHLDEQLSD